jgi:GNAT superfamily N-acetyltransferase
MSELLIKPHGEYDPQLGGDYDELFASLHRVSTWEHNPAEIDRVCKSPTSIFYLATIAERAVAMATLIKPYDTVGNRTVILEDFATHREYRRRGIARRLLIFLESEAIDLGATKIEFHSRPEREAAHRLYKSEGFDEVPTTPFRKLLK